MNVCQWQLVCTLIVHSLFIGQWEEARSHGKVAFGLNVAGTVLGVITWIIIIISLALFASVFGASTKALGDLSGDLSSVTIKSDWADWSGWDASTTRPF